MIDKRDWTDDAACLESAPELFFPVSAYGPSMEQIVAAKSICGRCRVRADCLDWALRSGEAYGIWGGTTPDERRYLRLDRLRRVPA